tara:strand:- start:2788 stop:3081 length:294 start_codon:yes stop_codon:yes gene_type:complete
MRVRISYSVDLEDVPNECARMLVQTLEKLGQVQSGIETLIDQLDSSKAIDWQVKSNIENCREELAKIDASLADNDMILEGYFSTKKPKETEDVASEG